jgi:thiamine-phosphate pyrophosphorylase
VVLTDRHQVARAGLLATVAAAVEGGARAVLVREKDLAATERSALVAALRPVLAAVGGTVLLAGADVELARSSGASGVHLAATDPWPPSGHGLVVGRSCHDAAELAAAAAEGADYATVSPVFASPSKPGYGPAMGIEGLAAMARGARLPVIALGGVTAATAGACLGAGAHGVAVMGSIMGADDPRRATAELAASLAGAGCGSVATG